MQPFQNLWVWQEAHGVALRAHAFSGPLDRPGSCFFRSQLPRAAISVPANIAEGRGRAGDRDFRRVLRPSLGSAWELEYHLLLIRDLGLADGLEIDRIRRDTVEVKRMLGGLIRQMTADREPPFGVQR